MSTTLWVGDKMYVVDEPVRDHVDELEAALAKAKAENEKLRQALDEIEAVACGETQIEADGGYDDSDGMKWIYDRTQALKEQNNE